MRQEIGQCGEKGRVRSMRRWPEEQRSVLLYTHTQNQRCLQATTDSENRKNRGKSRDPLSSCRPFAGG